MTKRIKVLGCELLYRELHYCAARSSSVTDLEFVPKTVSEFTREQMRDSLQAMVDEQDRAPVEAVVFAFGLCHGGTLGVRAGAKPLVVPRAHDCVTLLFGDKDRFRAFFQDHPDTRYQSSGMIERGFTDEDMEKRAFRQLGIDQDYAAYVEKYGEENARYIAETLGNWGHHYNRIAYLDMGLPLPRDYPGETAEYARKRGWDYLHLKGDLRLLQALFDGDWPEKEFLILEPGQTVADGGLEAVVTAR